ncbi:MAG: LiaI-LiaF-like domain-containing protein [Terriglobales bacterium]
MNDATLRPYRRTCGRGLFVPLIIIAVGVIFLLDQLHVYPADFVFRYFWPAVFIIFGLDLLSRRLNMVRAFWGVAAIAVGGLWILGNLGMVSVSLANWWPLLLIGFGLMLLLSGGYRGRALGGRRERLWQAREQRWQHYRNRSADMPPSAATTTSEPAADGGDRVDVFAIFGGSQRRVTSTQFTGGHVTACLGGFQLDLTRAEIAGESAMIEIETCMGGGEIRVPTHWVVDVRGHGILGGYSDETQQVPSAGAKRLIIEGISLMGGVVIKN